MDTAEHRKMEWKSEVSKPCWVICSRHFGACERDARASREKWFKTLSEELFLHLKRSGTMRCRWCVSQKVEGVLDYSLVNFGYALQYQIPLCSFQWPISNTSGFVSMKVRGIRLSENHQCDTVRSRVQFAGMAVKVQCGKSALASEIVKRILRMSADFSCNEK